MTFGQNIIYGIIVTLAVFFIGWITGVGGDLVPNLIFSMLMGVFGSIVVRLFVILSRNKLINN
jgi:hypothetical protein